jgi:hypothetical protein
MFALVLLGLQLTPDQVPTSPFPTDPRYPDTPYAAFPPAPTGWRDTDHQLEQEEIENLSRLSPQGIYGVSVPSAPPESSLHTMFAGTSPSLYVESYTQSGLQGNHASPSCGQVESITHNVVATQGQIATTQEVSFSRERRVQRKKEKGKARVNMTDKIRKKEQDKARKREQDRVRKRVHRDSDKQDYEKICDLLNIKLEPNNNLAHRSECLCIHSCERA